MELKTNMERLLVQEILKMCGKAILFSTVIGVVIVIIGYLNQWDSSLAYSNAFFLAGCLVIIAGGMSRVGAGEDWYIFQFLSAESFRNMSSGERASFIINASSTVHLVVLGLSSGVLLILVSVLVTKIF